MPVAERIAREPQDEEELNVTEGEKQALLRVRSTAEERRERNRGKRVKLYSKRMRQFWPRVAAFLGLRDAVALGVSCRRLQRLLEGDTVWQSALDRVRREKMTQLLVPRKVLAANGDLGVREKLKQIIKVRHNQDPTNALRFRLREAETEAFRLSAWQAKVRELAVMNLPLAATLLVISAYAFATDDATEQHFRPLGSGPASSVATNGPAVNPVKTFLLVQDLLLVVALAVVAVGNVADNALYTIAVLAGIEVVMMLQTAVSWDGISVALIFHATLVVVTILVNALLFKRKIHAYHRELSMFSPSY